MVSYYQNKTIEKGSIETSFFLETILEFGVFEEFSFAKTSQNIGVKDTNIGHSHRWGFQKKSCSHSYQKKYALSERELAFSSVLLRDTKSISLVVLSRIRRGGKWLTSYNHAPKFTLSG